MEYRGRILIVAEAEYQRAYSNLLELDGYQVTTAGWHDPVAEILRQGSFDAVLLSLPAHSASDYVRRVLDQVSRIERAYTPIILLSRDESRDLRLLLGNYGVSDMLLGPESLGIEQIRTSLATALRRARQLQTSGIRRSVEPQPHEVQFTSFYPSAGKVDTWHTLLAYVHLLTAIEDVYEDATRFQDELPAPKKVSSSAASRIARGTEITILPSCEGVEFNPPRMTIQWLEDYHRAEFRFRADRSLLDDAAKGSITFFAGPVIVATLKFAMLFNGKSETSTLELEDSASMYHSDRIFISYSHKDADVALMFRNVLEATGYETLIDVDDLRAGEIWDEKLERLIERADIFQLFWSPNSSQSEYCRKEWQHALKQNKGEGFIRPVYWQKPLPPPPKELSRYHFDYVELKIPAQS